MNGSVSKPHSEKHQDDLELTGRKPVAWHGPGLFLVVMAIIRK